MTKGLARVNKEENNHQQSSQSSPTCRTTKYCKPAKSLRAKDYTQCTMMGKFIALIVVHDQRLDVFHTSGQPINNELQPLGRKKKSSDKENRRPPLEERKRLLAPQCCSRCRDGKIRPCPPGGQSVWRDAPCTHLHLEISPACSTTDSLKKASEEKEKTQLQITK